MFPVSFLTYKSIRNGDADGKIRKAYEGELKYEFTYDGAYYEGLY